jgi:hypothetical protein
LTARQGYYDPARVEWVQSGPGGGPEAREAVYIFDVYKGRHNTYFSACRQTCQVFKERFPNEKRYVLRTANPEEPFFV